MSSSPDGSTCSVKCGPALVGAGEAVCRDGEWEFVWSRYSTAFCWGRPRDGGACFSEDFGAVTDIYATDYSFVALRKAHGTGFCWGDLDFGGLCDDEDFQGVTDAFATRRAFLALRESRGEGFCWGESNNGESGENGPCLPHTTCSPL